MQNKVKNEINCYSFELMIIFILSCWDFASAPICKKKCCSVLTTRIYKFHRVPIKARSKELEKKKGRKEGKEQEFSTYTGQNKPGYLWLKLLFFLYCCNTIYAFLHCLFRYFYFLSVSKDSLSLFLYCRHIFLVLKLFAVSGILHFKTFILIFT